MKGKWGPHLKGKSEVEITFYESGDSTLFSPQHFHAASGPLSLLPVFLSTFLSTQGLLLGKNF